jgi:hypothetical protein
MVLMFLGFISWLKTKDSKKLKKIALIFGGICLSTMLLTAIEFVLAFN